MCSDKIVVDTWDCMDGWRENCGRHLELYGYVEIKLWSTVGIVWMGKDKIVVDTWNCMDMWR